ncbi:MAG: hypothetical protein KDD44_03350 [Bdellovibrionales bacterium]|nr:hypothetical protein [Bdellovibrionales bacterium]
MNARIYTVLVVGAVFFAARWYILTHREEMEEFRRFAAAERQCEAICDALARGDVSRDELCEHPVPEIATFQERYWRIKNQDGHWYASHGWKFYPEVECAASHLRLRLMDLLFECRGSKAELVSPEGGLAATFVSSAFAEEVEPQACWRSTAGRLHTFDGVSPDGALISGTGERFSLAGVDLPEPGSPEQGLDCRDSAVAYLRTRIATRSLLVYSPPEAARDAAFRLPVFIEVDGVLLNQEMLRLGFGRYGGAGKPCEELLSDSESTARRLQAGLWSTGCFPKESSGGDVTEAGEPGEQEPPEEDAPHPPTAQPLPRL